jgi:hypothetical protein
MGGAWLAGEVRGGEKLSIFPDLLHPFARFLFPGEEF